MRCIFKWVKAYAINQQIGRQFDSWVTDRAVTNMSN